MEQVPDTIQEVYHLIGRWALLALIIVLLAIASLVKLIS